MQIRKLVKSGLSSFVVAVPKEWLEKNKLKAGDNIYLEESKDGTLIISKELKEKLKEKKEIIIDVDGKQPFTIKREILAAYFNNYYYINITGKELNEKIDTIKEQISLLLGMGIVEESSTKILLNDFLDLKDVDISVIIRRMDNIVRAMISDFKSGIKDKKILKLIPSRDYELDKLYFLVFRTLKTTFSDNSMFKDINITREEFQMFWKVNFHLEKIGDMIKRMAALIERISSKKHEQKIIELLSDSEKFYLSVMKSFHLKNKIMSDAVARTRNTLMEKIDKFIESSKDPIISHVGVELESFIIQSNDISRAVYYLS